MEIVGHMRADGASQACSRFFQHSQKYSRGTSVDTLQKNARMAVWQMHDAKIQRADKDASRFDLC